MPFNTRQGRFRQQFGPSQATPAFPAAEHGRGIYDIYAREQFGADNYSHAAEPGLYRDNPWASGNNRGEWL